MKTAAEVLAQRSVLNKELDSLAKQIEDKSISVDGEARFDNLLTEIETLNSELTVAEKREAAVKEIQEKRNAGPGLLINPTKTDNEDQVKKEFRFVEMINTLADQKPLTGFMKEINDEGHRDMDSSGVRNANPNGSGFIIPSFIVGSDKRDLASTTSGSAAGYTIATDLLANEWIDNLKNQVVVFGMGAKFMTGLRGNVDIPRKTTNSGANWLTETGSITAADFTHDKISMSPKRLGNATAFSRQLLAQSSIDIERLVREDLIMSQSIALQDAIIHGPSTGSGPLGILNTSGIGSVVIGNNGGALTWAAIVGLEREVAIDNALLGNLSYLTNSKVRSSAKQIVRDSGSGLFLWGSDYGQSGGDNFPLNGYKCAVTNAVPSTNVKGNSGAVCSSLIFGNWGDLYVGQWGGLVVTANPYALDLSGQVRVTMNSYYDVDVRHAESFAACNDITTT
jgi:HK97 family phage major capsid protein